ncbi:MAG: hypothetical protein QGD92_11315 [Gammaproteobacteria bacterium]|nr:hypothetical protein [Gammaproteobacteria bacterium]
MRAIKLVVAPVLGLVAIAFVLAYFLLSNLDDIVKRVIEDVGSQVTQTKVTLQSVHIDLKTGTGKLSGLTIANPAGYDSDYAFQLDNILVGIDLKSLSGPVIVITEVTVDGARLIAEQRGEKTNLTELLDNIEASSKQTGAEPAKPQEEVTPSKVRLMLENFAFINTSATIITEKLGETSLQLPDVRRKNIGNKQTGLTPEQLTNELLSSVIKEVTKAAGDYLRELAQDALKEKLKTKLKKKMESLKSLFKRGD